MEENYFTGKKTTLQGRKLLYREQERKLLYREEKYFIGKKTTLQGR